MAAGENKFSAVGLAAGSSHRMGRDKALLEIDGSALWRRQRDVLLGAGAAEIFLSARPEQAWAAAAEGFAGVVPDAVLRGGPLAGVAAALAAASRSHLAVLAVDLSRMEAKWFVSLLARCAPGVGAVGRNGNFFESLAAIYPRELLAAGKRPCGAGTCRSSNSSPRVARKVRYAMRNRRGRSGLVRKLERACSIGRIIPARFIVAARVVSPRFSAPRPELFVIY